MPILTEAEESRIVRERATERQDYKMSFQTTSDADYDKLYVAIDTDLRVNHRNFPDHMEYCEVFFDEQKIQAIRFNRKRRTIEWTLSADDAVKEIIAKFTVK